MFQDAAKLKDFYVVEDVIARYNEVGVSLDPVIFSAPLEGLARAVVTRNLADDLMLPLTGLCLGYPLEETLRLVRERQKT